jgi:hypothetical protein
VAHDAALRELAQTPLMLSVMTMAWRDTPAESFRDGGDASVEECRRRLFDAYVHAALRRKGASEREASTAEILGVLGWLARQMRARGQTLFALEQLQPDWLDHTAQRATYFATTRLLAVLALGVPFWFLAVPLSAKWIGAASGLLGGLVLAGLDFAMFRSTAQSTEPRRRVLAMVVTSGLVPVIFMALFGSSVTGQARTDLIGILSGYWFLTALSLSSLVDVKRRDIHPADAFGWSWRQGLRRAAAGLMVWQWFLTIGFIEFAAVKGWTGMAKSWGLTQPSFIVGAIVGAALSGICVWRWRWRGWSAVARVGALITFSAVVGLDGFGAWTRRPGLVSLMVLFVGLLASLLGGVTASLDEKRRQRTGTWFWMRVPLLAALIIGTGAGGLVAAVMLPGLPKFFLPQTLRQIATLGGYAALVVFVRFGGLQGMQHFVLRQLLAQNGQFPRRALPLLDEATRLNLLQKIGSGYRFIHALLLDHFADQETKAR